MKSFSLKKFIPLLMILAILFVKAGYFDRLVEEIDPDIKKDF